MKQAPVSKQALWQVAATLLVVTLFMAFVTGLHHSAPEAELIPLRLTDSATVEEFVSCERTLPEADDSDPDAESPSGAIGRVSASEVNQCPRRFDGRLVTFVGEAVGDVLRRTGGAWVQVNDDEYALGNGPLPGHRKFSGTNSGLAVWLPDGLANVVQTPGRRGLRGDVLQIEGFVRRVDPADGGGLTIRATDAVLLAAASPIEQPVHGAQLVAAILLGVIALGLVWRERHQRQKH